MLPPLEISGIFDAGWVACGIGGHHNSGDYVSKLRLSYEPPILLELPMRFKSFVRHQRRVSHESRGRQISRVQKPRAEFLSNLVRNAGEVQITILSWF